jgi:hypothetical protein
MVLTNLSATTATATSGFTISLSAAAAGAGGTLTNYYPEFPGGATSSQTLGAMGQTSGSAIFFPVYLSNPVNFNALRLPLNVSWATSTSTGGQNNSFYFGIYTNNAGTLSVLSSNSIGFSCSNSSISATISYNSITATGGYAGLTTTTANATTLIHALMGTNAIRILDCQFGNTMALSSGQYYIGLLYRNATSSAAVCMSPALHGIAFPAGQSAAPMGQYSSAVTASSALRQGLWVAFATSTNSANYSGTNIPVNYPITGLNFGGPSLYPMCTFVST